MIERAALLKREIAKNLTFSIENCDEEITFLKKKMFASRFNVFIRDEYFTGCDKLYGNPT